MKSIYVLQPYLVGSKHAKSLALIIPADVRREANVDVSTIFFLKVDGKTKRVVLQNVNEKKEITMSADESLAASKQQTLLKIQ